MNPVRAAERLVFGPGTARRLLVTQTGLAAIMGVRIAFGPYLDLAGQPAALFRPVPFLAPLDAMPGPVVIVGMQVVGTVGAALAVAGRRRRAAFPVAWLCLLVLAGLRSSRGKFLHNDALLLLAAAPFLLAPAVRWRDARAARATASASARYGWPVRTALVVVAGAYFFSGLGKLAHSGPAWVIGDNMRHVLVQAAGGGRVALPEVPTWMARQAGLAHGLAAAILLLELTFPVVLVAHGRGRAGARVCAFYASAAVAFHAGTWLALGLDYWAWAAVAAVVLVDWSPLVERLSRYRLWRPRRFRSPDGNHVGRADVVATEPCESRGQDVRERCAGPTSDRPGRGRGRLAVLPVLLAAALLTVGPGAAPALAATTMAVAGAYDGTYVPGRPAVVRVQVTADRLIQGRLEVTVDDGTPVGVPVEVPGGSTKELIVVVPGAQSFTGAGAVVVEARIRDGSTEVATARGNVQSSIGHELVGLLPGALGGRGLPAPAPLAVDAGTARFTALGAAELAQAPASLGPVSTVAASPDDLMRLPAPALSALLAWVDQGGHLLVDADAGQTVEGLPPAWQPGQDGRSPAGRGEVRLTGGAIAAGRWAGLAEPTGWAVGGSSPVSFGGGFVGQALAEEAGLRVPELGWLVAFLVAYVVVAGPLLFFVVRRRKRPELAWVALPLVALLFTTGSYVGGRGLRDTTRQVDSSILSTGALGSTADSWLGVFSAGGQTSRVRFAPGWMPGQDPESGTTSLSSLSLTADGLEGSIPLDAGQFGVILSHGPTGVEGAVEVTAVASADGQASGRVKNSTPFDLDDVAVFVGVGASLVGPLGAGEERDWQVSDTDGDLLSQGPPAEFQVWGAGDFGFDGFANARAVDFTLWEAAQQLGGQEFRGPGEVVAAGWTRSFTPPVEVDGRSGPGGGRSLVLGRARIQAPADSGALDIRREVVRAPDFRGGRDDQFVVRFLTRDADGGGRVPDPSRLTLRAPVGQLEAWGEGGWRAVDPVVPQALERNGFAEFVLPSEAVRGDLVYVRVPAFGPGVDVSGLFTLRERP